MDEVEQRFVVKIFFIKKWGNKKITAESKTAFCDSAISDSIVKRWIIKFNNGDIHGMMIRSLIDFWQY
jgi:hypothetical protein